MSIWEQEKGTATTKCLRSFEVVQELFRGAWRAGRVGRLSRPVTAPRYSPLIALFLGVAQRYC